MSLFDLDHTLLNKNSSFQFGIYLYRQKVLPLSSVLYYVSCYSFHKLSFLSLQKLHRKIFSRLFLGKSSSKFIQLAEAFVKEKFESMLYFPAVRELEEAKKSGHFTAIFSSSPDFLVSLIARRFKVHEWVATRLHKDDKGHFSTLSEVVEGKLKSHYLRSLSQKLNIQPKDFTAYSDSYHDLPFLNAAGIAIGVNPDRRLKQICKKNQWQII